MAGRQLKPLSEAQKAYLAGIIDGEGCISLRLNAKKGYTFNSNISVEMVGSVPLWIFNTTGVGHIYYRRRENRSYTMVMWVVGGLQAEAFVEAIKGYIVQKKEEIKQYLIFRGTVNVANGGPGYKMPKRIIKARFDCVRKLKAARYA